jgi:hypothetical protein
VSLALTGSANRRVEHTTRNEARPRLGSKVLVRRLKALGRRPGYAADLSMMHRLIITRGPRNSGEGMQLGSLKAKYPKEYGELRTERQGQQELLQR